MSNEEVKQTQDIAASLIALQGVLGKLGPVLETLAGKEAKETKEKKTVEPAPKRPIAPNLVGEFIEWFIKSPEEHLYDVKRGQWECKTGYKTSDVDKKAHTLIFHTKLSHKVQNASNVICVRPVGSELAIFNASRITYGTSWSAQKEPQRVAEAAGAVPIPFENVVRKEEGAGMDLSKLEVIEWAGTERMIIPPVERRRQWSGDFYVIDRHFAGATVVRVGDEYFLFDTDREELIHHGFNPFFTQLPHAVGSLEEAYAALMPDAVKQAVEDKLPVIRQGEFFFVPVDDDTVREQMIGDLDDETCDAFFYDQVRNRLVEMGAAVVNCAQQNRLRHVDAFVERCANNNGGKLPESEADAEEALANYKESLEVMVGPERSHPPEGKEAKDRFGSRLPDGSNHDATHLDHVNRELQVRLAFQDEDSRWSRNGTGPESEWRIRYQARIGSDGGNIRGQHRATSVFQPSDDVAYAIGAVIHEGREHRTVYLPGWHRVYPNTAVNNWTVSGDVD